MINDPQPDLSFRRRRRLNTPPIIELNRFHMARINHVAGLRTNECQ